MAEIFISYRRDDTGMLCERVTSRLGARFGARRVFRDTSAIYVGSSWEQTLRAALQDCYIVIALIGANWLGARDAQGRQRLFDPHDFVRLELASALALRKRVIPVLAPGARMPQAHELPPDLAPLAQLQPLFLRPDPAFEGDMQTIIQAAAPGVQRRIPHLAVALCGFAGFLGLALLIVSLSFANNQAGISDGTAILYSLGSLTLLIAWLLILARSLQTRAWVWLTLAALVGAPLLVGSVGQVALLFIPHTDAAAANIDTVLVIAQLLAVILSLAFGFGGPRSLARFTGAQQMRQAQWKPPARASRGIVGVCATMAGVVLCYILLSAAFNAAVSDVLFVVITLLGVVAALAGLGLALVSSLGRRRWWSAVGLAIGAAFIVVSFGLYGALANLGAIAVSALIVSLAIGVCALDLFALRSDLAALSTR